MFKTVFAATAALVITAIPAQAQTCTRDGLKAIVANYFKAVETHNMSALETAPNLRITQNGSEIKLGEGFFKPAASRNFNEPCSTRNAAARSHRPSLMKLRIPTRRHLPDEEEHAEQQVLAVQRPAVPLVRVRQVPVKVGRVVRLQVREAVRLQVREAVRLLRPLTPVPLSFLQCDLKSTKARSVKSKRSSTGRGNSSSAPRASSQRRIMIGKVFFRPHSAARANT
jgi:hypothetical protein